MWCAAARIFLLNIIAIPLTNKTIEVGSGTSDVVGLIPGLGPGLELGFELGLGLEPGLGPVVGLMSTGTTCGGAAKGVGMGLSSPRGIRNGIAAVPISRNQSLGLRVSSNGYTATSEVVSTSGFIAGISFSG